MKEKINIVLKIMFTIAFVLMWVIWHKIISYDPTPITTTNNIIQASDLLYEFTGIKSDYKIGDYVLREFEQGKYMDVEIIGIEIICNQFRYEDEQDCYKYEIEETRRPGYTSDSGRKHKTWFVGGMNLYPEMIAGRGG